MAELKEDKWYEICRACVVPRWGYDLTISDQDIEDMALSYDPAFREGSVGIGHDGFLDSEKPRHGVISELMAAGGRLFAKFKNLSKDLKDGVAKGLYHDRSAELRKIEEKWYVDGVAFLGRSQPAVPSMAKLSANEDKNILSVTFDLNTDKLKTPDKGDTGMDEKEVKALLKEQEDRLTASFNTQLAALNKRADVTPEKLAELEAVAGKVTTLQTALTATNAALETQTKTLHEKEVADLCIGVPKSIATDDFKAALLEAVNDKNSVAFKSLKNVCEVAKKNIVAMTTEILNDKGEPINDDEVGFKVHPDADPESVKIARRAAELKAADDKLSLTDATIRAAKEVKANG